MTINEGPGIRGTRDTSRPNGVWARYGNAVLGAWLFISAFAWAHSADSQQNSWIVGILMCIAAVAALYAPAVRFVNTALAAWLFISTLTISHAQAFTAWHNAILAILAFGMSLVPSVSLRRYSAHGT